MKTTHVTYDQWKLDTPEYYDDELYETSLGVYHHSDEELLDKFERMVELLANELGLQKD